MPRAGLLQDLTCCGTKAVQSLTPGLTLAFNETHKTLLAQSCAGAD